MNTKFQIQDRQYDFPYHYTPHFNAANVPSRVRFLSWGFEYLCYLRHVRDMILALEPESLLDVGCGDGRLLGMLDGSGIRSCGVDLSEQAVGLARAFHPSINYRRADAASLDEQFDMVTAIEVLEHIPDDGVRSFLGSLRDRTRPGGTLIISVPTDVVPVNAKHYRHYNRELLLRQVGDAAADLELEKIEYVFRPDFRYNAFRKLTHNRLWTLEMPWLNSRIWRHIWNRLRLADAVTGRHLIAVFRRND